MKKTILLLTLLFSLTSYAQEDYGVFLENALQAIENNNEKEYIANMKIFSVAIQENNITPENIQPVYFDLYVESMEQGFEQGYVYNLPENITSSFYLFIKQKAIKYKDINAMHALMFIHSAGIGVQKDEQKALYWNKQAAESGHLEGMWVRGNIFLQGIYTQKNIDLALEWYERAADAGFTKALFNLGMLYYNGEEIKRDYIKAREYFEKAHNQNYTAATAMLGGMYEYGLGVNIDLTRAFNYYTKSITSDEITYEKVIHMLIYGYGTDIDYDLAFVYTQAYQNVFPSTSSFYYGLFYYKGFLEESSFNIQKDYTKAIEWFKKATEQGNFYAPKYLGDMCFQGEGMEPDEYKGVRYYKIAAERGHPVAMKNLGYIYLNGMGTIQPNQNLAIKYYQMNCNTGDQLGCEKIKQLQNN